MQDKAVYTMQKNNKENVCKSTLPPDHFRFNIVQVQGSEENTSETKLEANCIDTSQQCYNSHYEHETKPDAEAWIRA